MEDNRTVEQKVKPLWEKIYHIDIQTAMLRNARDTLMKEIMELEAAASIPAIIDRVVLENADAINKLSKV